MEIVIVAHVFYLAVTDLLSFSTGRTKHNLCTLPKKRIKKYDLTISIDFDELLLIDFAEVKVKRRHCT